MGWSCFAGGASAQPYSTVIDLPEDSLPATLGSNTQLNIGPGGHVPSFSSANFYQAGRADGSDTNIEINLEGGTIGPSFQMAGGNSRLNIVAGRVGNDVRIGTFAPSLSRVTVNVSGGSLGPGFTGTYGTDVVLTGGRMGHNIDMACSVGVTGQNIYRNSLTIHGGEFKLEGQPISSLPDDSLTSGVFSGVLADGTPFVFASTPLSVHRDVLPRYSTNLQTAAVPPLGPMHFDVFNDNAPAGLRPGQSVAVGGGGDLGQSFVALGGSVAVDGGTVGDGLQILNGSLTLSGGSVGEYFRLLPGSTADVSGGEIGSVLSIGDDATVNLSGGQIGSIIEVQSGATLNVSGGHLGTPGLVQRISSRSGSEINLVGRSFRYGSGDDDLSDELVPGVSYEITEPRWLRGRLLDGRDVALDMRDAASNFNRIDPGTRVTVTLIEALAGDFDGNGTIGQGDLDRVLLHWGDNFSIPGSTAGWTGDLPQGVMAQAELDRFLLNWGNSTPPSVSAVPEPTAVSVAGLSSVLLLRRRRVAAEGWRPCTCH